jgi:hypothetical protein
MSAPCSAITCGFCKDWFSHQCFPRDEERSAQRKRGEKPTYKWLISRTVEEFKSSANLGCPVCWWLMYGPCTYEEDEWTLQPGSISLHPETLRLLERPRLGIAGSCFPDRLKSPARGKSCALSSLLLNLVSIDPNYPTCPMNTVGDILVR